MTLQVHFLANELAKWESGEADSLVVTFFSDERPLRGAAGLVDWRLGGWLSKLLKGGKLAGGASETTMIPPAKGRLSFSRILLFGLGGSAGFDEGRYKAAIGRIREVLSKAGVTRYALQPPGRATGLIAARRALELLLDDGNGSDAEVFVIESATGQKEMAEALRRRS